MEICRVIRQRVRNAFGPAFQGMCLEATLHESRSSSGTLSPKGWKAVLGGCVGLHPALGSGQRPRLPCHVGTATCPVRALGQNAGLPSSCMLSQANDHLDSF